MKIFHWKGAFGKDADILLCEKVIEQVLAGDYKSAGLEKLRGHAVYSARINHTHRVLLATIYHNNTAYLQVLEVLLNHGYEDSKVLNNRAILKLWIQQGTEELAEKIIFDNAEDIPKLVEPTKDAIEWVKTQWNGEQFIILTDAQGSVSKVVLPAVVYGVPGGGKTYAGLDLLYERSNQMQTVCNNNKPLLYVTKSQHLLDKVKNTWEAMTGNNQNVEFKTWSELKMSLMPELNDMERVDETFFKQWLKKYIPEYNKKNKFNQNTPSKWNENQYHAMYLECQLIMAFIDKKQDYIELGQRECGFECKKQRLWLFEATVEYLSYLKREKKYNLAFCKASFEPHYSFVVADEVHDFPITVSVQLKQLSSGNIVYCIDTHQKIEDNPHIFSLLLNQIPIAKDSRIMLRETLRSCQEIAKLDNKLLDMFYNITGGKTYKEEYTQILCDKRMPTGEVLWINEVNQEMEEKLKAVATSTDFAVIIADNKDKVALEKTRNEVKAFYKTGLVLTVEESKGLEFHTVVLDQFFDTPAFFEINQLLEKEDYQATSTKSINRPKHQLKNTHLSIAIEQAHIAVTRAKNAVIFVQKNQPKLQTFLKTLKETTEPLQQQESYQWQQTKATTSDQWLDKTREFIKNGQRELACGIFVTNLGRTEKEFDAFYSQLTKPQPKEPRFFQASPPPLSQVVQKKEKRKAKKVENTTTASSTRGKTTNTNTSTVKEDKRTKDRNDVAYLIANFTTDNLRRIFTEGSPEKIFFEIKDKHNLCLLEQIIKDDRLLGLFHAFLKTDIRYFEKFSASKLWDLFKNTLTTKDSFFLNLISRSPDHMDFFICLIIYTTGFAKAVDLNFLQQYQRLLVPSSLLVENAREVELKYGEKAQISVCIDASPLFLLTYGLNGRDVWMELVKHRPDMMSHISEKCFLEYAYIVNDTERKKFGTVFNNLADDRDCINLLDGWITTRPSYAIAMKAEHLSSQFISLKAYSYSNGAFKLNTGLKFSSLTHLPYQASGVRLLNKILSHNPKVLEGITTEHLTQKFSTGESIFFYLVQQTSLFIQWITTNQTEFGKLSLEELFYKNENGITPLYLLLRNPAGQALLFKYFECGEKFANRIDKQVLCVSPIAQDTVIPLFHLVLTEEGREVLLNILTLNKTLLESIELKLWQKQYGYNVQSKRWQDYNFAEHQTVASALSLLEGNKDSISKQITELVHEVTSKPLEYDDTRPFYFGL